MTGCAPGTPPTRICCATSRSSGTPLSGTVVVVGDRWGALVTALAAHRPTQITDSFLGQEATRANLARDGVEPGTVRLLTTQDTPPGPRRRAAGPGAEEPRAAGGPAAAAGARRARGHGRGRHRDGQGDPHLDARAVRADPRPDPHLARRAEGPADLLHPGPRAGAARQPVAVQLRPARRHRSAVRADRSSTTRGCSAPTGSTSAPGSSSRHLPPDAGRPAGRRPGLRQRRRRYGGGAGQPGGRGAVRRTSRSRRWPRRRRRTGRTGCRGKAEFRVGDGLAGVPAGSVDLVLNNPPFHSHQATTDATAWRMFTGARRALRPGGELWVVGNRHSGYHVKLRRLFGNSRTGRQRPEVRGAEGGQAGLAAPAGNVAPLRARGEAPSSRRQALLKAWRSGMPTEAATAGMERVVATEQMVGAFESAAADVGDDRAARLGVEQPGQVVVGDAGHAGHLRDGERGGQMGLDVGDGGGDRRVRTGARRGGRRQMGDAPQGGPDLGPGTVGLARGGGHRLEQQTGERGEFGARVLHEGDRAGRSGRGDAQMGEEVFGAAPVAVAVAVAERT